MGGNVTKEHLSTWDDDTVITWKEKATSVIKSYYLSFRGSQFDEYIIFEDEDLLLAKICFAMFGPPTKEDADELIDGYDEKQKESAKEILDKILEVHEAKNGCSRSLLVGIIVIACKQDEAEFPLPIFSVFTGSEPENPYAARAYVDTQKRTYTSWQDWKDNNTLPMLKYAYPTHGFFSASEHCKYEFDEKKDPSVEFGTSPACNMTSRILGTTDMVTGVTSLACGAVAVASLFTPVGPAILLASAIGGGSSAVYGTGRAVARLYDKSSHGGSLTDLESYTLWFSIAATPFHFATSIVNAQLVRGAVVNGRIFSSSMRMFATVLNFSTIGIDTVLIGFGIANLIEKNKQNQMTSLDVLQFSMSVFFFTNTLIRPKTANSIIKNAQETHIQNYANSMTDADAQASFQKFLDSNKGDGSIKDTSKVVRTINRINDPDKLFGSLKNAPDIKIGGRKGKTLLVSDQNAQVNRINPNKVTFGTIDQGANTPQFRNNIKKMFRNSELTKAELNGEKIFDNLNDLQKSRVNKAIGGSAGCNVSIVEKAISMSKDMNLNSVDEVLSVVEILSAKLKQEFPNVKMNKINATHLDSVATPAFTKQIQADCLTAMSIASREGLKFENPLLAAYHYHKHGKEFAKVLKNQKIEVYLTKVPDSLIQDGNLTSIETVNKPDGTSFVKKTYVTSNDNFAVVLEFLGEDPAQVKKTISTMFNYQGAYEGVKKGFCTTPKWTTDLVGMISQQFSLIFGFRGRFQIFVNLDKPEERFELFEED